MTTQKLAYTYDEAAAQCGYPVRILKQAVSDGSLTLRYADTEGVIRHEDLAAWISQLPTRPTAGTSPVSKPNTPASLIKDDRSASNKTDRPRTADPKPAIPTQASQVSMPESKSEWLTAEDLATMWQIAVGTVNNWRGQRRGPEFVRIGGLVRYSPEAVKAWVEKQPTK